MPKKKYTDSDLANALGMLSALWDDPRIREISYRGGVTSDPYGNMWASYGLSRPRPFLPTGSPSDDERFRRSLAAKGAAINQEVSKYRAHNPKSSLFRRLWFEIPDIMELAERRKRTGDY